MKRSACEYNLLLKGKASDNQVIKKFYECQIENELSGATLGLTIMEALKYPCTASDKACYADVNCAARLAILDDCVDE